MINSLAFLGLNALAPEAPAQLATREKNGNECMGNRTHEPPPLRTAKETNQEANHMPLGLSDNLFNKGN
jgi:hypothetical protein